MDGKPKTCVNRYLGGLGKGSVRLFSVRSSVVLRFRVGCHVGCHAIILLLQSIFVIY